MNKIFPLLYSLTALCIGSAVYAQSDEENFTSASDTTRKINETSATAPPRPGFVNRPTAWTVCRTGCTYTDPMTAWNAAMAVQTFGPQKITISVADGTYDITRQFESAAPSGASVSLIGNTTDNSRVVFNFTNIKGTNHHGFYAHDGGNIGLVDGITMNGVDAIISATETGITWNKDSYGAGFYAFGPSRINLGAHLAINRFYYSVLADDGGFVSAPHGGVTATYAGDVNFLARHNGVIDCEGCSASYAADTTWSGATLGCNYMAEDGGEINVTGSTGQYSLVGAVCARTGGHGWASNFTGKGGLGGQVGSGLDVRENGTISAGSSTYTGYAIGAWIQLGGYANVDSCAFRENRDDGIYVTSFGKVEGNAVTITGNGGFGIHLQGQSSAILYNTLKTDIQNKGGLAYVETAGTRNGYSYAASSLYLQ